MCIVISAVICTHNRADYLPKAIQSLAVQSLGKTRYEICVVDNGSTDMTRVLVESLQKEVTNLRYLSEPRLGLNVARNAGWKAAQGQYVAYLDDDAVASENWLAEIVRVFTSVTPAPGCVGGKVELIWERQRPSWLDENMASALAQVSRGDSARWLTLGHWIVGCNFAFPKQILMKHGGFDDRMDRKGKCLLSNGDLLIQRRLQEEGEGVYYSPNMLVQHHVPISRVTRNWFWKRYYWQGVSDAVMGILLGRLGAMERWRRGLEVFRSLWREKWRLRKLAAARSKTACEIADLETLERLGRIAGYWHLHG